MRKPIFKIPVFRAGISDGQLTEAEGLRKSDDMPAIVDRDGGLQGRLTLAGFTIADGFEEFALGFGLHLGTAQVSGQRM
ncbi:MAG: hypothetical protein PVI94_25085, partial [Desulfobacterales bacterium]